MKKVEMEAWLTFDDNIVGNVINWNNATINAVNLIEEEITKDNLMREFAERKDYQIIVMEKQKSFADAIEMCKSIGGELAVPNDNVNVNEFGVSNTLIRLIWTRIWMVNDEFLEKIKLFRNFEGW